MNNYIYEIEIEDLGYDKELIEYFNSIENEELDYISIEVTKLA